MKLYLSVFRDFLKLIFKLKKNSGEQEKESIIRVRSALQEYVIMLVTSTLETKC